MRWKGARANTRILRWVHDKSPINMSTSEFVFSHATLSIWKRRQIIEMYSVVRKHDCSVHFSTLTSIEYFNTYIYKEVLLNIITYCIIIISYISLLHPNMNGMCNLGILSKTINNIMLHGFCILNPHRREHFYKTNKTESVPDTASEIRERLEVDVNWTILLACWPRANLFQTWRMKLTALYGEVRACVYAI